jgi:hypothetical protein
LIGVAKTVRWVQYEAAGFVRIEVDEDGWDTEITKVVTANDTEELHLARDDRGHFRVYDETFEPAAESEILDGIRGAGWIPPGRHPRAEKSDPAWDDGIDPRRDPHWYTEDDENQGDDIEDDGENGVSRPVERGS